MFHVRTLNNMATKANTTTTEAKRLQLRGETSVNYTKEKVCRRLLMGDRLLTSSSINMKTTFHTSPLECSRLWRNFSILTSG